MDRLCGWRRAIFKPGQRRDPQPAPVKAKCNAACTKIRHDVSFPGSRLSRETGGVLMSRSGFHNSQRGALALSGRSHAPAGARRNGCLVQTSGPLALAQHGRNVTDEQIRACAATGGVVCVSGVSMFLQTEKPSAHDVAIHAAYVADLVGVEHAGIGLDISFRQSELDDNPPGGFNPDYWWPRSAGYDRALMHIAYPPIESWEVLGTVLLGAGMSPCEAAMVMGGNMMRMAARVWGVTAAPPA